MESSGLPEHIQISEQFKETLLINFTDYLCILRKDKVIIFYNLIN